jgi:ATP-dependent phosphoenolpyruvate carboxykinase
MISAELHCDTVRGEFTSLGILAVQNTGTNSKSSLIIVSHSKQREISKSVVEKTLKSRGFSILIARRDDQSRLGP